MTVSALALLALVMAADGAPQRLTLDEVRAAARQNVDALKAELDLKRAGAGRTSARAAILPQLGLTFSVSDYVAGPQRTFAAVPDGRGGFVQQAIDTEGFDRGNFSLQLQVTQLLYDGGKWWNQIGQAGAQEEAAQGQLAEQRLASELEAVRRFYELVRGQMTLKVLQATVDRSKDQVARAQALYAAGRGQRSDVLDAQTNLANDQISVLRQQQAIVGAEVDLLEWIGRPVTDVEAVVPQVIDAAQPPGPPPAVDAALASAREHRPLLVALERQARASELGVSIARGDYLPRLSANVAYQRGSPTADPFFTNLEKQNAFYVGATLSWDLFSGFATRAQVERAEADLSQAQNQQRQAAVELEGEVRRAVRALGSQVQIADLAEKNLALARSQLELESERYAAGAASSLDVRNAQVKLTQAELTQLQGRIDVEIARASLHRLLGGTVEGAQ